MYRRLLLQARPPRLEPSLSPWACVWTCACAPAPAYSSPGPVLVLVRVPVCRRCADRFLITPVCCHSLRASKGDRHLEIDCWDGVKKVPIVTHGEKLPIRNPQRPFWPKPTQLTLHLSPDAAYPYAPSLAGHTFCTIELFDNVAKAVADCAFVYSNLPVILSLEVQRTGTHVFKFA
eukprot:1971389-Prymnesium_polylepis.3